MAFNWEIAAFVSRLVISAIAFMMSYFFWGKYQESKRGPSPNYYYFGNYGFFLANGIVILLVGLQELLDYFSIWEINFDSAKFYWVNRDTSQLFLLENLGENPVYVILSIYATIIFFVQISPLESLLKQRKVVSRLLLVDIVLCALIFVPPLTYTYYEFVALILTYASIFLAFLVNFVLTAKIIKNSAGIVKKRAILNISGFSLYLLGLVWSMRVGWTQMILVAIGSAGSLGMDVLVGNVIIFLAVLLYYRGFTAQD